MSLHTVEAGALAAAIAGRARRGAEVFAPARARQAALVDERWVWRRLDAEDLARGMTELGPARATEPLKSLAFPPRGEVSRFFGGDEGRPLPERIIVGARQCDLASVRVLDFVFLEGAFKDPFYEARRASTLVISADCPAPYDVCFCTFVEGKPHPDRGFDLNLSKLDGSFVVETGTEKSERFVEEHKSIFREAPESDRARRDEQRRKVEDALRERLAEQGLDFPGKVRHVTRGREEHDVWLERARDCVECGACNFVCPTCHCFCLLDVEERGAVRRFAEWDSCLYPKFALVAGGANPRPRRAERLLNRFEKKFGFFCDNMDALACTGCGRCVEACAGKIDLRDVLKELVK
jgi:ferredoxin